MVSLSSDVALPVKSLVTEQVSPDEHEAGSRNLRSAPKSGKVGRRESEKRGSGEGNQASIKYPASRIKDRGSSICDLCESVINPFESVSERSEEK
jgi:hypothetical protein